MTKMLDMNEIKTPLGFNVFAHQVEGFHYIKAVGDTEYYAMCREDTKNQYTLMLYKTFEKGRLMLPPTRGISIPSLQFLNQIRSILLEKGEETPDHGTTGYTEYGTLSMEQIKSPLGFDVYAHLIKDFHYICSVENKEYYGKLLHDGKLIRYMEFENGGLVLPPVRGMLNEHLDFLNDMHQHLLQYM